MYYGHASWAVLLLFGLMIVMRTMSSRRRRGAPGRGPATRSFTGGGFQQGPGPSPGGSGDIGTGSQHTGIPPGWLTDPSGRHEQRYWSGSEWTEHVSDGGVPSSDPPPSGTGRRDDS